MNNNKNVVINEKKKNWLSPNIKNIDKLEIKSFTFSKSQNRNPKKTHLYSISIPSTSSKNSSIKVQTDFLKNDVLRNVTKSDICNSNYQTTTTNYTNNFNHWRPLKQLKSLDKKNYFNLNKRNRDNNELNKESNTLNLKTLYCGVNTYRIFNLKAEKPKFFTNKLLKKNFIDTRNADKVVENLKSSNFKKNNSLQHNSTYSNTFINKKNINKNIINSIVESLLNKKEKKDNDKNTDSENINSHRCDYISPMKYINYNFENDPENKTKFKSFKKQGDILGSEKTRNKFVENINEYYENKKVNYNFQKPSGFDKNDISKDINNKIIHSMFNDEKDIKNVSIKKRANSYLYKNLYVKTEKNERNAEYYDKLRQIYDQKNMPLDSIISEILLRTKDMSFNDQKRKKDINDIKKKLNF